MQKNAELKFCEAIKFKNIQGVRALSVKWFAVKGSVCMFILLNRRICFKCLYYLYTILQKKFTLYKAMQKRSIIDYYRNQAKPSENYPIHYYCSQLLLNILQ